MVARSLNHFVVFTGSLVAQPGRQIVYIFSAVANHDCLIHGLESTYSSEVSVILGAFQMITSSFYGKSQTVDLCHGYFRMAKLKAMNNKNTV